MPDIGTEHHHSHPCQPDEDHPDRWILNPGPCDALLADGTACGKTYAEAVAEARVRRAQEALDAARAGASRA